MGTILKPPPPLSAEILFNGKTGRLNVEVNIGSHEDIIFCYELVNRIEGIIDLFSMPCLLTLTLMCRYLIFHSADPYWGLTLRQIN